MTYCWDKMSQEDKIEALYMALEELIGQFSCHLHVKGAVTTYPALPHLPHKKSQEEDD